MKKNFIYISTPIVLLLIGIVYRFLILADAINETSKITEENKVLTEMYNRDVFSQNHVENIKKIYDNNIRGEKSYGEFIVELLGDVESMLKESKIKYEANKINQDTSEKIDHKSGTTTFAISLSFESELANVYDLVHRIETNKHLINISYLKLNRSRVSIQKNVTEDENSEQDEYNINAKVFCEMKLEFIKYL